MSETINICCDQRRPVRLDEPHGAWWLTVRLPLGENGHVYFAAATADRFVPGAHSSGRVLVDRKRLAVLVMPRKFYGRWRVRDWVRLHRFCAHVHVTEAGVSDA